MTGVWKQAKYYVIAAGIVLGGMFGGLASAQQPPRERDFALQVTPSPIVESVDPGKQKTIEFKIQNRGSQAEQLRMNLRAFTFSEDTGDVQLTDQVPAEVSDWVSFAYPQFNVAPGATFTQQMRANVPADAGFSYSFAVLIQRAVPTTPAGGRPAIEGSVAVFTLLSVNRPGAERKFSIVEFSSKKRVYEYLPAELSVKLRNTGNTITQPVGNVFIQRSSRSNTPITVLSLNPAGSYLLPGMNRTINVSWEDGFPLFTPEQAADNVEPQQRLSWDWGDAEKFRIGRYVARMVAVYNDGQRDVPVQAEVAFWVFPWKLFIGVLLVIALLGAGLFSIGRSLAKVRSSRAKNSAKERDADEPEE